MKVIDEIWKDVPEYENIYKVSNTGLVKSLERYTIQGRHIKEKLLKGGFDKDGYRLVLLCKDGDKRTAKVHRLVAQAFLLMNGNKPMINHKDGNVKNNNVYNLEWCNILENNQHAFNILNRRLSGVTIKRKKVKMYTMDNIYIKTFDTISKAQQYLRINGFIKAHSTGISYCCKGKQKYAYNHKWEYVEIEAIE